MSDEKKYEKIDQRIASILKSKQAPSRVYSQSTSSDTSGTITEVSSEVKEQKINNVTVKPFTSSQAKKTSSPF